MADKGSLTVILLATLLQVCEAYSCYYYGGCWYTWWYLWFGVFILISCISVCTAACCRQNRQRQLQATVVTPPAGALQTNQYSAGYYMPPNGTYPQQPQAWAQPNWNMMPLDGSTASPGGAFPQPPPYNPSKEGDVPPPYAPPPYPGVAPGVAPQNQNAYVPPTSSPQ
ncbi:metacaspase-1 [Lingula anatina]|uniref:Metacaspase-1 n=1 Tax=Lingula anatina TaxID=7574 RepID=A0A1S3IFD3_LINAN|nr:metacaspase-1 [Lingula anatina]|eukprot:XP_013396853.1 metacaspase-1 [Lingula anatina]